MDGVRRDGSVAQEQSDGVICQPGAFSGAVQRREQTYRMRNESQGAVLRLRGLLRPPTSCVSPGQCLRGRDVSAPGHLCNGLQRGPHKTHTLCRTTAQSGEKPDLIQGVIVSCSCQSDGCTQRGERFKGTCVARARRHRGYCGRRRNHGLGKLGEPGKVECVVGPVRPKRPFLSTQESVACCLALEGERDRGRVRFKQSVL